MTKPKRPTCNFRLSIAQLRLLEPGLRTIVVGLANPVPRALLTILPPPKCSTGRYAKCHGTLLRKIWKIVGQALNHPTACGKVRLRLDCIALAACLLAGRISLRVTKKDQERRSIPALLSHLERIRKRSARSYVRRNGKRSYAQASRRWRQFVRWVRANVLRKVPRRLVEPGVNLGRRRFFPKYDRRNVELAMQAAERELTNRGERVPPQPKLRSLVRRVFRMSHRSMTAPSIYALTSRPEGAHFLAWFILKQTRTVRSQCRQEVEQSEVEPPEVEPPEVERQEAGPVKSVGSHKPCTRATITSHPLFQQLKTSYPSLNPVDRADYVSQICRPGEKLIRPLAYALHVDPGTIRRALKVNNLSPEQKAEIRSGKSVDAVLRAANPKADKPDKMATPEEKVAALQAEIVQFVVSLDLGPGHAENMLDCVIDRLERLHTSGKLRGRKRSRMTPYYVRRYTRPKGEPDPSDHTQWLPGWAGWLLRYAIARQPEYEISHAALCRARSHFEQMPRYWESPALTKGRVEEILRDEAGKRLAIASQRAESMRSPQSRIDHAAHVKQKERERQERERREAAAANEEYLGHMRQWLSGDKSAVEPPYARPEIKPTTIGEELEPARQQGIAGAEQRVENTCKRMGWPEPGARPETAGTVEQALTPPTQPTNSRSSTGVAPDVKADGESGPRQTHDQPNAHIEGGRSLVHKNLPKASEDVVLNDGALVHGSVVERPDKPAAPGSCAVMHNTQEGQ